MMSISTLRKHFWQLVRRLWGGCSWPRKYGFSGCIPAVVSSTDGANEAGTSDPEGRRWWPRCSKNSRKFLRISSEVIIGEGRESRRVPFGVRGTPPVRWWYAARRVQGQPLAQG